MAQGDKWRIGVGVKIPNHSFRFPTTWGSTLSANYTSGTRIYIADTTPDFDKILKVGDKITIGPSSHSGHEGSVETKEITAIDTATPPTYVDIDLALTYDYDSGDKVFALGHALAGGWTIQYPAGSNPLGIDNDDGKDDNWSQKITLLDASQGDFRCNLGYIALLASTPYRFGIWYKGTVDGITVWVIDIDGSWRWYLTVITQSSWTETSKVETSASSGSSNTSCSLFCDVGSSVTNFFTDCWYLQHAKGSSGEANGYYEFSEIPDAGIKILKDDGKIKRRLPSGALRQYDPSGFGERSVKLGIKATFSNVSQTFWDQLQIFQKWQDKGNLLNLFPFIDDLPPFLQGVMEIKEWGKSHWDLGRRTFDLTFWEA